MAVCQCTPPVCNLFSAKIVQIKCRKNKLVDFFVEAPFYLCKTIATTQKKRHKWKNFSYSIPKTTWHWHLAGLTTRRRLLQRALDATCKSCPCGMPAASLYLPTPAASRPDGLTQSAMLCRPRLRLPNRLWSATTLATTSRHVPGAGVPPCVANCSASFIFPKEICPPWRKWKRCANSRTAARQST